MRCFFLFINLLKLFFDFHFTKITFLCMIYRGFLFVGRLTVILTLLQNLNPIFDFVARTPRQRRKSKSTTSQAAAQPSPQSTCWESCTWRTRATAGASARHVFYQTGMKIWIQTGKTKCPGGLTELLVAVCVHRAIIIRNNEILPMSSEFTPESERQRLQFLVRCEIWFVLKSHTGQCFYLS